MPDGPDRVEFSALSMHDTMLGAWAPRETHHLVDAGLAEAPLPLAALTLKALLLSHVRMVARWLRLMAPSPKLAPVDRRRRLVATSVFRYLLCKMDSLQRGVHRGRGARPAPYAPAADRSAPEPNKKTSCPVDGLRGGQSVASL